MLRTSRKIEESLNGSELERKLGDCYTFSYTKDGEAKWIPARYSFTYVKDGNDWKIADHHSIAAEVIE